MNCKIIFAKIDLEEKACEIAENLLKKKLALIVDIIETKEYSLTITGRIKKERQYLLIVKTHKDLTDTAKKELLKHILFEKADIVIFDAINTSARMNLLLEKLKTK